MFFSLKVREECEWAWVCKCNMMWITGMPNRSLSYIYHSFLTPHLYYITLQITHSSHYICIFTYAHSHICTFTHAYSYLHIRIYAYLPIFSTANPAPISELYTNHTITHSPHSLHIAYNTHFISTTNTQTHNDYRHTLVIHIITNSIASTIASTRTCTRTRTRANTKTHKHEHASHLQKNPKKNPKKKDMQR